MGIFTVIIGTMTTIFTYLILIAALQKLFAISKDMSEIKEMLREVRREREAAAVLSGARPET